MTATILRISTLALGLAATPLTLAAQDNSLAGVWNVNVTVKNCQTGALVRTVHSLQMFLHDGSVIETPNTASRGVSLGTWNLVQGQYEALFWFFRYNPDGTFASFAKAVDLITPNNDVSQFTSSGTIQDYDANYNLISTDCFTHTASRMPNLSASGQPQ